MYKQTIDFAGTLPAHDRIPLACDRRGQGETMLLFIHGWTCRRAYWIPQLEVFSDSYQVVTLDLPGHGDSGCGERTAWGLVPFARDIESGIRALGASRVILIGHSMGGAVALEAARLLEETVAGVVLVDTFAIDYGGLPPEMVQAFKAAFTEDFPAAMAALIEQTSTAATPPAVKDRLSREMGEADPAWALPVWYDLLEWSPQAAFHELQLPIYAINGGLIPDTARERCAPFVTETVIPGAGHFLQMEDPAGFNQVLREVLDRIV